MKKGYTLIELLSVIVILAVISAIAYPKILDLIATSKISAYNSAKGNIIESAKLKYLADVNAAKITEYTVDDLIQGGYLKKETKNPLTNEEYENTKVMITNDNGKIVYNYIEGNTLYDIISKLDDKDGLYKQNNNYVYKGINSKNYIYFKGEIYRILKIDSYRNVYILKDNTDNIINIDNINDYKNSYYNDNYLENEKDYIISIDVLNYQDYINSFIDNDTYIENYNNIWIKNNKEYKVLSYLNNELINTNEATIRFVLKIKNVSTILDGNGTQLNPYILH